MTPGKMRKTIIGLLLTAALCFGGCARSEAPPIGEKELEAAVETVRSLRSRLSMFLASFKKTLQDSDVIVMGEVIETYNKTGKDLAGRTVKYFVSRLRIEKVYEGDNEPGDVITLYQIVESQDLNEVSLYSVAKAGGYFEKGARLVLGIGVGDKSLLYPSSNTVLWLDEENNAIEKERPVLTEYPLYKPKDWYAPLDEVCVTDLHSLEEYEEFLERFFQWEADGCPSDKGASSAPESSTD